MKLFTCAYCLYAVNILTVLVANLMVAFGIFAVGLKKNSESDADGGFNVPVRN